MQKIMRMRAQLLACLCWVWTLAVPAQTPPLRLPPGGKGFAPEGTTLVVKFKPQTDSKARRILPNVRNHYVLQQLGVESMPQLFPGRTAQFKNKRVAKAGAQPVDLSQIYRITIAPDRNVQEAIRLLESNPAVEYAELLHTNYQPLYVPNDPQAQPGTGEQYQLGSIKAYQAWDIEKGNPAITIGIVDFGIDVHHEDLKDNIQYNYNDPVDGADNDFDGYVDNFAGWNVGNNTSNLLANKHGSIVAGCAAGTPDNGKGIAGVGFKSKFLPVTADAYTCYEGFIYAVERGCQVINLSWGRNVGGHSRYEQDLINYAAINYDAVVVAAAGNDNNTSYYWPASYDNVISVAATDKNDLKGYISNYNERVDISAPGIDVYSTNNGGYESNTGTSFATPLVSGAAALLRARFPTLTASEIIDRLVTTADPIYHLPGNAPYMGMLGKGRLNVYRALSDAKGVQLVTTSIGGSHDQPDGSRESKLAIQVRCAFGSFDNLQATLTSTSPQVTVNQGDALLGALSTFASATNNRQPFVITIAPGTPPNAPLTFTLTYRDGAFTGTETFVINANQDYLNVNVNQLQLTATSRGRIGYNDDFRLEGLGIRYKNQWLLNEAGLVIGASPTRVSDCVRDNTGIQYGTGQFTKNNHFRSERPIWYDQSNGADFSAAVTLTNQGNPDATGLRIRQQVYAWKDSPYDKAVVFEYKITNVSGADLPQLFAGIFADWDIYTLFNNKAAWDADRQLGYVFNKANPNLFTGVQLLTAQTPQYYAFDDVAGINTYDGFLPEEKYLSLSGGVARAESSDAAYDVTQAVGANLSGLKNGETCTVAFAILAGDNLADLQSQADAIRQQFIRVKTSPAPVLARTEFCVSEAARITSTSGTAFNLYTNQAQDSPVGTRSSFNLGPIQKDTTVYISGTDSLYESPKVAVTVKAVFSETSFTMNRDTIGLYEKHLLELSGSSADAVKWQWDFGDGSTAGDAQTSHLYTTPGEYTVFLRTTNSLGCESSASRKIRVLPGLKTPSPIVSEIRTCPGAPTRIEPRNGSYFKLYTSLPLTQPIATGTTFDLGPVEKDTVFYVTGADFLLESEPVAVSVQVVPARAAFGANLTHLDLRNEDVLQLTDRSTGAQAWHWDFGDGITSETQHPVHRYAQQGEYTVTLQCRNSSGCTDSTAQRVTVVHTLVPELARAIAVYPNPTSGVFYLSKDNGFLTNRLSVTVVDVLGKAILRREIDNPAKINEVVIPAKGFFLVRISANGQTVLRRVLVL